MTIEAGSNLTLADEKMLAYVVKGVIETFVPNRETSLGQRLLSALALTMEDTPNATDLGFVQLMASELAAEVQEEEACCGSCDNCTTCEIEDNSEETPASHIRLGDAEWEPTPEELREILAAATVQDPDMVAAWGKIAEANREILGDSPQVDSIATVQLSPTHTIHEKLATIFGKQVVNKESDQ